MIAQCRRRGRARRRRRVRAARSSNCRRGRSRRRSLRRRLLLGPAREARPAPARARGVARGHAVPVVVESLQRLLAPILRLDADDPVEEWRSHVATLHARAEALESASLRAVRFHDCADTDLRVGLLRCARWPSGAITTNWGRVMVVNVPTDEVFTTPDNRLTEGTVAATRPFQLLGGAMVEGARPGFGGGRGGEGAAGSDR